MNRIFVPNQGNLANGTPTYQYGQNLGTGFPERSSGVATSNGERIGAQSTPISAGSALAGVGAAIVAGSGAGAIAVTGAIIAGAGALNRLININPSTGAADGVSTLSDKTTNEQRVDSINSSFSRTDIQATSQLPLADQQAAINQATQIQMDETNQNAAATQQATADLTSTPPISGVI